MEFSFHNGRKQVKLGGRGRGGRVGVLRGLKTFEREGHSVQFVRSAHTKKVKHLFLANG